jgi:hypothetical protein
MLNQFDFSLTRFLVRTLVINRITIVHDTILVLSLIHQPLIVNTPLFFIMELDPAH